MLITEDIVMEAIKPVLDPEVNLSIVDLGLIYGVEIKENGKKVTVEMTLTSPMCPYGPQMVAQVEEVVKGLPLVVYPEVKVVWEPQWDPRTMASDEVKDKLGIW